MARTRAYRNGSLADKDFPIADVSDWIADPAVAVWVHFHRPSQQDLATIADELDLHALAVEDAVQECQRPKLDRYRTHAFLAVYAADFDTDSGVVATHELVAFVTGQALVTVGKDDGFDIDAVLSRWDDTADLAGSGVAYLLHGLLDYVADGYFAVVQAIDDEMEQLEDLLFQDDTSAHYAAIHQRSLRLRRSVTALRRVVLPMREAMTTVMLPDTKLVDDRMRPYFRDVHDHVLRAADWTDSLRELAATVRETQLSIQSNRLNVVMKKVTSWAAIIAIPTAVTGFYGQNVPYPGFQSTAGFWTSAAVIVVLAVGLYLVFRKKDWL